MSLSFNLGIGYPEFVSPLAIKPEVDLATYQTIDLRVGTIESVEDIAGSSKLVRLLVDFGDHKRKILAGMKKERHSLAEMTGKQALFVVNIPSRTMAGEVSEGMIVDIGSSEGLMPALAMPEWTVPNGSRAS